MSNDYRDRLAESTFRQDVECEVRLVPEPRDEGQVGTAAWISERLLSRLRHLGLAYDLQLLARLPDHGQMVYPEVQLIAIEDELAFLFEVVSDPALLRAALAIRELLAHAKSDPRGWSLVVETP